MCQILVNVKLLVIGREMQVWMIGVSEYVLVDIV